MPHFYWLVVRFVLWKFMVILCKIHYLKCPIFHRGYIFLHLSVLHCIIYLTKNVSKWRSKRRYIPSLNSVYYSLQQQNNFVSASCSCRRLLDHSSLKCCSFKFEGICLSTSLLRPSYSMSIRLRSGQFLDNYDTLGSFCYCMIEFQPSFRWPQIWQIWLTLVQYT